MWQKKKKLSKATKADKVGKTIKTSKNTAKRAEKAAKEAAKVSKRMAEQGKKLAIKATKATIKGTKTTWKTKTYNRSIWKTPSAPSTQKKILLKFFFMLKYYSWSCFKCLNYNFSCSLFFFILCWLIQLIKKRI